MSESKRRGLSPEEQEMAATALAELSDCHLTQAQLSLYRSIESYFAWDRKLSNKQLDALERLHRTATRGVYGSALSDSDRLNAKLNVVFNPMKNGRKH